MKRIVLILAALSAAMQLCAASRDSLALAEASWQATRLGRGAVLRTARVDMFESCQTISYVRFPARRNHISFVSTPRLERVSSVGSRLRARAGINAGYWNVRTVVPSTYIRIDGRDVYRTEQREAYRVDGVVIFRGDSIAIFPCDTASYQTFATAEDNILAVGPVLMKDGVAADFSSMRNGFRKRHPRSVVGYDADGMVYMIAVDGRSDGNAAGMSCDELVLLCRYLGLKDAINLDGGGSTTLWCKKAGVVNHPCDNRRYDNNGERRVSSTILLK